MIEVKIKDCGAIVVEIRTAISPDMPLIEILKKCQEELEEWIKSLNARINAGGSDKQT